MKKRTKPSMTELADAAFEQAMAKVIERAIHSGTPIIIWENGEVKKVDPRTFVVRRSTRK